MIENIAIYLGTLFWAGWMSLLDYLAAHVLLCLVPAFVIAGYVSAMVPKEVITRYLGPKAPRWISYPAASIGGFILAVCSCTILPLFASIWKRGAGLGVAITFLFVGPAVNILAIAYTGAAIGMDIAIARITLSIAFGILIGLIMARVFQEDEAIRMAELEDSGIFDQQMSVKPAIWIVFALLIAVLLVGTLQVSLLTATWFSIHLPIEIPGQLTFSLEGLQLTPQGALLILLLVILAPVAYLGLEGVLERFNRWTYARHCPGGFDPAAGGTSHPGRQPADWNHRSLHWRAGTHCCYRQCGCFQLHPRRAGWLALGNLEVCQADLSPAGAGSIPGGCFQSHHPRKLDPVPGRAKYDLGKLDWCAFRCIHVFPNPGGSTDCAHVPRSGHASRSAAGLLNCRPRTFNSKHPGDEQNRGSQKNLHLCQPGGHIRNHGRLHFRVNLDGHMN